MTPTEIHLGRWWFHKLKHTTIYHPGMGPSHWTDRWHGPKTYEFLNYGTNHSYWQAWHLLKMKNVPEDLIEYVLTLIREGREIQNFYEKVRPLDLIGSLFETAVNDLANAARGNLEK